MPILTTRREIIASLLGLPAAMSCARRPSTPSFDGRFVEDGMTDGHRLRDGHRVGDGHRLHDGHRFGGDHDLGDDPTSRQGAGHTRVLVLGGGVAGLAAGWRLSRGGLEDFRVLEMASEIGGTAVSGASHVSRFPWGAHYLPVPRQDDRDLVAFLGETGVMETEDGVRALSAHLEPTHLRDSEFEHASVREDVLCREPEERVFHHGRWQRGLFPEATASPGDLADFRRFERAVAAFVEWRGSDGRRAFRIPVVHSSEDGSTRGLDEMSMETWLTRERINSSLVRWFVEYACRDDFGASLADTSAWYGVHYFASRRDRAAGESAEVMTWPEGNGFLVEHLGRVIGRHRVECNTMVLEVSPAPSGRGVDVLLLDRTSLRTRRLSADYAICALPSFLRGRVLRGYGEEPLYTPTYSPWLVANVHLRGRPRERGFEVAWDNVMVDSASLGYVVASHQLGASFGPTVFTYYLPFVDSDARAARARLASLSWEEAAGVVVHDLRRMHPDIDALIERVDIMRWGHGMVRPVVGSFSDGARRRAAAPVGALHFAHSDLSGVALFEEAFHHGVRAADEVLARHQRS